MGSHRYVCTSSKVQIHYEHVLFEISNSPHKQLNCVVQIFLLLLEILLPHFVTSIPQVNIYLSVTPLVIHVDSVPDREECVQVRLLSRGVH